MKYAAALVCVVLLLSVASAYAYDPVSDIETAALRSGMNQISCNDVEDQVLPIYFRNGETAQKMTMKRWVRFSAENASRRDLGGKWSKTEVSRQTVDYVLYWVNRARQIETTTTVDSRTPVKIYSRPVRGIVDTSDFGREAD
ncbi:MAG: hypothetical protein ACM3VW_05565 [Bacteroidota bacterium]